MKQEVYRGPLKLPSMEKYGTGYTISQLEGKSIVFGEGPYKDNLLNGWSTRIEVRP